MSLGDATLSRSPRRVLLVAKQVGMVIVLLGFGLTAGSRVAAETVTVDCNTGGAVGPMLARLKPGDVLLVEGTCRENILLQAGLNHITLDGQGKATIHAPDARQPAVQVLGREITIKGLIVTGGQFGIAINRGATAIVEGNTMQNAALSGLEVSQNSFARVVKNIIRQNQSHGRPRSRERHSHHPAQTSRPPHLSQVSRTRQGPVPEEGVMTALHVTLLL